MFTSDVVLFGTDLVSNRPGTLVTLRNRNRLIIPDLIDLASPGHLPHHLFDRLLNPRLKPLIVHLDIDKYAFMLYINTVKFTPINPERRSQMNRHFKDVLEVALGLVVVAVFAALTIEPSLSHAQMDETVFKRTRIAQSDLTGEVVKSEPLADGLHKVQVQSAWSEKQDTLLATTELPVGTKVRHLWVEIINPGNDLRLTVRFAFPIEPPGK